MTEQDFDQAMIASAFAIAARDGWHTLSISAAAREAGLPLTEARTRFPSKRALAHRFGAMLDQRALAVVSDDGSVRDRLFDMLMERYEAMRPHRAGIVSLLRSLPFDPCLGIEMACATRRSMRWMLEAAGVPTSGPRGHLRVSGLVFVWTWVMRTFERDESDDLSATMAALDKALGRADELARFLAGERTSAPDQEETDESEPFEPEPDPVPEG
jgi:ubiquinone biosynthesis protein COQ9